MAGAAAAEAPPGMLSESGSDESGLPEVDRGSWNKGLLFEGVGEEEERSIGDVELGASEKSFKKWGKSDIY